MESDAYQEYFKRLRNKISLAMWVLINNNVCHETAFILLMIIEFAINVIIILCLYQEVGCVNNISAQLVQAFDYTQPNLIAIVAIGLSGTLILTLIMLGLLVIKQFQWETYSSKKVVFQLLSFILVLIRGPLLNLCIISLAHSYLTFSDIEDSYLKSISVTLSFVNTIILTVYIYFGSYLFNLATPNDLIPWSCTSNKPYLLQCCFKLVLVITFLVRDNGLILMYSLTLLATFICAYRIYFILLLSHTLNGRIQNLQVIFEFALLHFLVFLLITVFQQQEMSYLYFVAAFLPVTCLISLYLQQRSQHRRLMIMIADTMEQSSNELTLCCQYLLSLCLIDGKDMSQMQMLKLQAIHSTRCEPYFQKILVKMTVKQQLMQVEANETTEGEQRQLLSHLKNESRFAQLSNGVSMYNRDHYNSDILITKHASQNMFGSKKSDGTSQDVSANEIVHSNSQITNNYSPSPGSSGQQILSNSGLMGFKIENNLHAIQQQHFSGGREGLQPVAESSSQNMNHSLFQTSPIAHGQKIDEEQSNRKISHFAKGSKQMRVRDISEGATFNIDLKNNDNCILESPSNINNEVDYLHRDLGPPSFDRKHSKNYHPEENMSTVKIDLLPTRFENLKFSPQQSAIHNNSSQSRQQFSMSHVIKNKQSLDGMNNVIGSMKAAGHGLLSGKSRFSQEMFDFKVQKKQSQYINTEKSDSEAKQAKRGMFGFNQSINERFKRLLNLFKKNLDDREERKRQVKKLASHYFNTHLSDFSKMDFKVKLLKIYFTLQILKNPYLAHFLIFSMTEQEAKDDDQMNIIEVNERLINRRYIEAIIGQQDLQEEELLRATRTTYLSSGQFDLKNMLVVNQKLIEFDDALEKITYHIQDFWKNLVHGKNIKTIFNDGISISQQLRNIDRLLNDLYSRQNDRDIKLYLQMAQFYNLVVFKLYEQSQMHEKAMLAIQTRKLYKLRQNRGGGGGESSLTDKGSSDNLELNQEKCLIMTDINIDKSMKIVFANKAALKLLKYKSDEISTLSIGNVMPSLIAESHQKFVVTFLKTGKAKVLKQRRSDFFVKQKHGSLVSVSSYLSINNLSRKHMILIFEENTSLNPFGEPASDFGPPTFLLTNKDYKLEEISHTFYGATGISHKAIKNLQRQRDKALNLEDIVQIKNYDCDIAHLQDFYDTNEANVVFENVEQAYDMILASNALSFQASLKAGSQKTSGVALNSNCIPSFHLSPQQQQNFHLPSPAQNAFEKIGRAIRRQDAYIVQTSSTPKSDNPNEPYQLSPKQGVQIHLDSGQYSGSNQIENTAGVGGGELMPYQLSPRFFEGTPEVPQYQMKIIDVKYLGGRFEMKVIAFRRIQRQPTSEIPNISFPQFPQQLLISKPKKEISDSSQGSSQADSAFKQYQLEEDIEQMDSMDLNSQSSAGSSSIGAYTISNLSTYTQHVNNDITPRSLKLILYVTLILLLLMIGISTVLLAIALENISLAKTNYNTFSHSLLAVEQTSTIRLLFRGLANINLDYLSNQSPYFNRTPAYESIVQNMSNKLQFDSAFFEDNDSHDTKSTHIVNWFITSKGSTYSQAQPISKSLNLLTTKVQSLLAEEERAHFVKQTTLPILNMAYLQMPPNVSYNQVERDYFFLLNNTNGQFYDSIISFGPEYSEKQIDIMAARLVATKAIALSFFAIMMLSALVVVPLYGKIQDRIAELMRIFFVIDAGLKNSILEKIDKFIEQFYKKPDPQQLQQNRLQNSQIVAPQDVQNFSSFSIKECPQIIKEEENQTAVSGNRKKIKGSATPKSKQGSTPHHSLGSAFSLQNMRKSTFHDRKQQMNKKRKGSDDTEGKQKKALGKAFRYKGTQKIQVENIQEEWEEENKDNDGPNSKTKKRKSEEQSSQSNDDSSDDEDFDKQKAHGHKKQNDIQGETKENIVKDSISSFEKELENINEFKQYTSRRKWIQSIVIVLFLTAMSSYFITIFLVRSSGFEPMKQSVSDMELMYYRTTCQLDIINAFTETYFSGTQNGTFFERINEQTAKCLAIEKRFLQSIYGKRPAYFSDAMNAIVELENGDFCNNTMIQFPLTIGEHCLDMSQQIRKQGLSTYFYEIIRAVKQLQIDLQLSLGQSRFSSERLSSLLNNKISPYIDMLVMVIQPVSLILKENLLGSLNNYQIYKEMIVFIIFSSYLIAALLFSLYFFFSLYWKIRQEMLQSNRLLFIIDFESISEAQRNNILKFLKNL